MCTHSHIHTQLNEFRGGVSPCQSQEESNMLLQIKNNASASLCVKRARVLLGKKKKISRCVLPSLLCRGVFALGR